MEEEKSKGSFQSKYKNNKFKNNADYSEESSDKRMRQSLADDKIDERFEFTRVTDFNERVGFMVNMHAVEILDENKRLVSGVDFYFLEEDGRRFKATVTYAPYFYVLVQQESMRDLSSFLKKKYDGVVSQIDVVTKEDLDLPNHLIGLKQRYLKLSFPSMTELMKARKDILTVVRKNKQKSKSKTIYAQMMSDVLNAGRENDKHYTDQMDNILDIREYDVPYHARVCIDLKLFAGLWYSVQGRGRDPPILTRRTDLIETPDLIVLAFDIECTKQPLKFPDAASDMIMMISYMVDGQGYLINNRQVISADVDDFEYTPYPEFEGNFIVMNEPDEKAVLEKFFEHIADVKPHVIATYNGDNFDWPFVEQRAAVHNLTMALDIGFTSKDGVYASRPIIHMDCLCWVKRDSYLPVGSQNLKAVAKAKLRYDPVEIDPEDMCAMAAEEPQTMCNYSVSDAVATYYLYMKYVHPFIFALCTILPMEPDEALRKGSGTLCELLLMVEAFDANIIFPNKQEQELNKTTADGHILDSETYVGGHVEAIESGVFRADIPCRFKLDPDGLNKLKENVRKALVHAIEEEEKVPVDNVVKLDEVVLEIQQKLEMLQNEPMTSAPPVILHLDVGAMYPNIILTNRLQPSAIVNEETCAACDFNRPGATCQRKMNWTWRGERMPASRNEFLSIQQQLETEKFPPQFPGGPPRAFHQLSREEAANVEKVRLQAYCRRAYKKTRETKTEVRTSTICQMENSFYVDTVRAFRDRRYEYKGLCKDAKKAVVAAVAGGDAREIKSAKNREVLYDSLQLAHKCILNSFYGYVMRRGARWFSMEMAGIVCQTGAGIIMKACKLIEQIGRPLELDTDGIWCILPNTFPQDYTINTTHEKKKKLTISYPNAILNCMVKEHFTNDQYHELVDSKTLKYEQRSENTIFFEVDGPYLAMVLPASKEKGKKLKKRYAVFNFDKSLAELKGFEVKRRGELQLIKNFQSSVFECFLQGDTLQKCYEAVAKVADYWLDVLYSKASNMPDSELFELISEKKSMSKKLEEYGAQKSTSISTAKRLAEFLGDQMVKDKGLACRFVISRKPEGAPVTERAIPLAIFQSEPSVRRHFLRKWLKDSSLTDPDIRQVLDWNYYIERLNGTIQKIITIPAALQSVANPVPRVKHPDWLHKEMLEKNDVLKQRRMNDFFKPTARPVVGVQSAQMMDVEDAAGSAVRGGAWPRPVVVSRKRKRGESAYTENELAMSWREALGPVPPIGTTRDEHVEWLKYQKKKWALQLAQRRQRTGEGPRKKSAALERNVATMGGFIKKTQRAILDYSWQVIQFVETNDPGVFRVWALVNKELHCMKLNVPRVFYVNKRTPRPEEEVPGICRKAHRQLPRSRPSFNLYEYTVPERDFQQERESFLADLSTTDVEGIYETQMPLEFRLLITLGCRCEVKKETAQRLVREGMRDTDTFSMFDLNYCKLTHENTYLADLPGGELPFKHIFLYQHHSQNALRSIYALFLTPSNKAAVFVLDTVISKTFPNASQIYTAERNELLQEIAIANDVSIPEEDIEFDVQHFSDSKLLYRAMQRALQKYRDEKRGATIVISQTAIDSASLVASMPELVNFPVVALHRPDSATLYSTMEWQKVGARALMRNYLRAPFVLADVIAQCRYLNIPIGNLHADPAVFGADVLYARHLMKNNLVLWCSPSPLPDLGGRQADDGRLLSEMDDVLGTSVINNQGAYSTICVELDIDTLAVNTLLQSHHVQDIEGANANLAFDAAPTVRVDDSGSAVVSEGCDDSALSGAAFRVLRATVAACLKDVATQQNAYADQIVTHFYRWLRHPNALLYEPVLFRTLHSLMKKLFIQLVAEFRRLGSVVVHADFSKIVICTRKLTATDADCCVQYILDSIQNKELFHSIHITPSSSWEYLLWMNPANYGGIKLDTGSETSELSEGSNVNVNMNWSLAERLPMESHVRELFNGLIMRYIGFVWCKLREERSQVAAASPQRRSTPGMFSQVPPTPMGVGVDDSLKSITVDYITGDMSQRMFDLVQKIHKKLPSVKCTAIGMNGEVITPALEFAKAVTKVLELDSSIAEPVTRLRRNMLKLLGVGEFSREAEWKEPCVPAILPEVICANCNHCRDLDLCNDPHITSVDERPGWSCSVCESSYDMNEIEFQLMENVQKKIISYTLQDLQCAKCRQIQADNLTQYCTCAGNFNTLISTDALRAYLATIESVCEHYQLQLLKESIVWMRTSMRL